MQAMVLNKIGAPLELMHALHFCSAKPVATSRCLLAKCKLDRLVIVGDGKKLGLYGFGAAYIVAQIAKWPGGFYAP